MSTGTSITCIALSGAETGVKCFGKNNFGVLPGGDSETDETIEVVDMPLLTFVGNTPVAKVSVGKEHACALLQSGLPVCWGSNTNGMAGGVVAESEVGLATPLVMPNGQLAVDILATSHSTLVLLADGTAFCFGYDQAGECGVDPDTILADHALGQTGSAAIADH